MELQNGDLHITSDALHIKDGQKKQYLLLKIALFLSFCIGLFNLYKYFQGGEHYSFLLVAMGFLSVFILIWLLQYSNREVIALSEIKKVKEKNRMGRKSFEIYLKSGRKRELMFPKHLSDINDLTAFFKEKGFL